MFSRSEKTEEALDPMAEAPSGQRSPMVLAALAGLLAIAGAFLLVWYLNTGQDGEVAAEPGSPEAVAAAGSEASKQVLVVTQAIPRGTSVRELVAAPTVYLSARAVPEQFVAASAITSVAELQDLDGLVLASEALPGEQLLRGRFRDPNDFDSNDETFLEASSAIETPALHHAVVFELPAARAMGGNIRAGERITIVGNFRASPLDGVSQPRETSIVVLNSVKVLQIQSSLEVAGQLSQEVDQVGIASRGTYRLTVAVRPEQLTDLAYAIEYGELMLATALVELTDEEAADFPRGITMYRQIAGDDGIWLNELDDGDIVDLVELFPATGQEEEGVSIEVELPDSRGGEEEPASDDAELVVDEGDEEGAPGDS